MNIDWTDTNDIVTSEGVAKALPAIYPSKFAVDHARRRRRIPYVMRGGRYFYSLKQVKEALDGCVFSIPKSPMEKKGK